MSANITALYAEWLPRITARGSEAEVAKVLDEIGAIERKLAAAPAVTARDLLAKARIADHYRREGWQPNAEDRDMLKSMIRDLERFGGAMGAAIIDPAVVLWQRWAELRRQANNLPPTDAGEEEQDRLCEQWSDVSLLLSRTPATSLAGVAAKLRVLAAEIDAGKATDDRDLALAETARQDIERLAGCGGTS